MGISGLSYDLTFDTGAVGLLRLHPGYVLLLQAMEDIGQEVSIRDDAIGLTWRRWRSVAGRPRRLRP